MTAKRTAKPKKPLSLKERLAILERDCRLVPHTNAGRLYSSVRRMKAEKEMKIPIRLRSGFACSVRYGKAANELTEEQWEEFYASLCEQIKTDYPEMYAAFFPNGGDVPPGSQADRLSPRQSVPKKAPRRQPKANPARPRAKRKK